MLPLMPSLTEIHYQCDMINSISSNIYFHFCAYIRVCVPCICYVRGDQKTTLYPLALELQVVVSHHVGAGNQTIVLSASATDTLNP